MMLLRESHEAAGLEGPFPAQISDSQAFSFVGSLELTYLPELRTHNGRRSYRKKKEPWALDGQL